MRGTGSGSRCLLASTLDNCSTWSMLLLSVLLLSLVGSPVVLRWRMPLLATTLLELKPGQPLTSPIHKVVLQGVVVLR